MEKVSQSVEEMLLDYLDGNLTNTDKEKIEKSLQENPSWRARYQELQLVNSILSETKIEQPSKNFTPLVMNRLDQYHAPHGFSVWNSILLLAGVLIAIGITTVLLTEGMYDSSTTNIDLNQIQIPKELINTQLPSFEFSGKIVVNIIIILNLAIAWIVLDRAILKPFFQRRMQAGH
jgi:predicted anti-sigma-YlaC factor YlaD